jgi:hypothetical protein
MTEITKQKVPRSFECLHTDYQKRERETKSEETVSTVKFFPTFNLIYILCLIFEFRMTWLRLKTQNIEKLYYYYYYYYCYYYYYYA